MLPLQFKADGTEAYKSIQKWYSTRNRQYVELKIIIFCSINAVVDVHNNAGLLNIAGDIKFSLYATQRKHNAFAEERPQNALSEYVVPEITHCCSAVGGSPHCLLLKTMILVMILRNVLFSNLMNEKLFIIKHFKKNCLFLATVDDNCRELESFPAPRITFKFCFHLVSVTRR